ncbi:hypothetical protein FD724_16030 [Nostoc sp. C057]|nr:hypothetical protein FD724_16030 [Nostoc sp. C057]
MVWGEGSGGEGERGQGSRGQGDKGELLNKSLPCLPPLPCLFSMPNSQCPMPPPYFLLLS